MEGRRSTLEEEEEELTTKVKRRSGKKAKKAIERLIEVLKVLQVLQATRPKRDLNLSRSEISQIMKSHDHGFLHFQQDGVVATVFFLFGKPRSRDFIFPTPPPPTTQEAGQKKDETTGIPDDVIPLCCCSGNWSGLSLSPSPPSSTKWCCSCF